MVVKAYSPFDELDVVYRRHHPIPITARGNNCYLHPFGIAGDLSAYPKGTIISVPGYGSYTVDDTGKYIRRARVKWVEVRFKTTEEAKKWGKQTLTIQITYPEGYDK